MSANASDSSDGHHNAILHTEIGSNLVEPKSKKCVRKESQTSNCFLLLPFKYWSLTACFHQAKSSSKWCNIIVAIKSDYQTINKPYQESTTCNNLAARLTYLSGDALSKAFICIKV